MKEKPRFYCDNCGFEVAQDAIDCPECGKSFASVRCPVCGFSGEVEIFDNGCPGCGYSSPSETATEIAKPKVPPPKPIQKPKFQETSYVNALPLWVYIVTGIVFGGVLMVFYLSVLSN
ncbi:MAG: zinc ribbon domain-containing protein [Treponema sp.]|jgi:predicted amidophosphoribosyltransferase|nr:zinc ribbon domain-containing protein [Treponema sp.]